MNLHNESTGCAQWREKQYDKVRENKKCCPVLHKVLYKTEYFCKSSTLTLKTEVRNTSRHR